MEMAHFVATVVEREGGRKERETDRQRENEGGRWQQRDPVFNSGGGDWAFLTVKQRQNYT